MELEFLKNGISLPDYFNALPCFHQNYRWLADDHLQALFSLKFPFLDGLDVETISKVKNDNHDEFASFSRTLLDSVTRIKSAFATKEFMNEVRYIQENQIDAALSDVSKTVKRINQSSSLRKAGILVGLLGLNAVTFLGAAIPTIISGLAAAGVALIHERVAQLKQEGELKDSTGYFLWKLQHEAE